MYEIILLIRDFHNMFDRSLIDHWNFISGSNQRHMLTNSLNLISRIGNKTKKLSNSLRKFKLLSVLSANGIIHDQNRVFTLPPKFYLTIYALRLDTQPCHREWVVISLIQLLLIQRAWWMLSKLIRYVHTLRAEY